MVALVATWAADSGWGLLSASTCAASSFCGQGMREPWSKEHEELVGDSSAIAGKMLRWLRMLRAECGGITRCSHPVV